METQEQPFLVCVKAGHVCILDIEDEKHWDSRPWNFCGNTGWLGLMLKTKKRTSLSRLVMGLKPGQYGYVDHINGDTHDNRKHNLRICSAAENTRNSKKPASGVTSKYKGVYYSKVRRKYIATITVNCRGKNLGGFQTQEEAAHAYDKAARECFGEYARVNFPVGQERSAI